MSQNLLTPNPVLPVVRVAILAQSRLAELALPAELPLREILPAVQRLMAPIDGDDADDVGGLPAPARLSLAPIGGAPFSLDASLDTVGVVDGDLLALQPVPVGPPAPGIVEDIADAAVIFSAARTRPWGIGHIQRGARAAVITLILVATGLAIAHRLWTGERAGLYTVAVIAVVTVITAAVLRGRAPVVGVELSVTAFVPIAAALALAVPDAFGPAQVMLAAAGVVAWSLVTLTLPGPLRGPAIGLFTATAVLGAGLLAAGAAAELWHLPPATNGCLLILLALLVTVQAAQLSALWARLPLPVIPAPGDAVPSAPSAAVLADLPRRVRSAEAHQSGFIAGAVLLSVLGSLSIAGRPESHGAWGLYLVVGTSAAAALRARVWDTAACKAWLLAQPFLVTITLLVAYALGERALAALVAVAVLAGLTLIWLVVAINPGLASPESYSLPLRRLVGFLAAGIDASLIPVMAYLVGLFAWVLNR